MRRLFFIFILASNSIFCQSIIPNYFNNFDSANDTIGWKTYASFGTSEWEWGPGDSSFYFKSHSYPNVWGTNLDSFVVYNKISYLETPYFNLSDTSRNYVFEFHHVQDNSSSAAYVEYSLNHGVSWNLLYTFPNKSYKWQTTQGFSSAVANGVTGFYPNALTNIKFIQGNDSVKFRFKYEAPSNQRKGWQIDDFSIHDENVNFYTYNGQQYSVKQYCGQITPSIKIPTGYTDDYVNSGNVCLGHIYLSTDNVLDSSDTLLTTFNAGFSSSTSYNFTFFSYTIPSNLSSGTYYLIYYLDADTSKAETNENDNIGMSKLYVRPTLSLPYIQSFENITDTAQYFENYIPGNSRYEISNKKDAMCFDARNGDFSVFMVPEESSMTINNSYLVLPPVDMRTDTGKIVLNYWYREEEWLNASHTDILGEIKRDYVCYNNYSKVYNTIYITPTFPLYQKQRNWNFINYDMSSLKSDSNISFSIFINENQIDDIYLGTAKPDLSIENKHFLRFTDVNTSTDTLKYRLVNSGLWQCPPSITSFYWSNDSILDQGDTFLGIKNETGLNDTTEVWATFSYTKPTTSPGIYYIFYKLDTVNAVDEMREYDNEGYFRIDQQTKISVPYFNDFENSVLGWRSEKIIGKHKWEHTSPKGRNLHKAFSGSNVWVTEDTGSISTNSLMVLYSPIFDLSNLNKPVLDMHITNYLGSKSILYGSFSLINVLYSLDEGASWYILDTSSLSQNRWNLYVQYDQRYGVDEIKNSSIFWQEHHFKYSPYVKASSTLFYDYYYRVNCENEYSRGLHLNNLKGKKSVRFMFQYSSGPLPVNFKSEGYMMDDFKVSEAYIDLRCKTYKNLYLSNLADTLRINLDILNQGNYRSDSTNVHLILTSDSTINSSTKFVLNEYNFPPIQPNTSYRIDVIKRISPANLNSYKYLVIVVDSAKKVNESDENNNITILPLGLSGITQFPYLMDFNSDTIDGWHYYHSLRKYSFKDPGYYHHQMSTEVSDRNQIYYNSFGDSIDYDHKMSADHMLSYWSDENVLNLLTPAFDFSKSKNIELSFFLKHSYMNNGNINMHYSIDGGDTWTLMGAGMPTGYFYRWYNINNPPSTSNALIKPGWPAWPPGSPNYHDSIYARLDFLKGQPNVVFKFMHKNTSDWGSIKRRNFVLDDFLITADTMVLPNTGFYSEGLNNISSYYSNSQLTILSDKLYPNCLIQAFDISGKLIYEERRNVDYGTNKVEIPSVSNGIYLYYLKGEKGEILNYLKLPIINSR